MDNLNKKLVHCLNPTGLYQSFFSFAEHEIGYANTSILWAYRQAFLLYVGVSLLANGFSFIYGWL